MLLTSLLMCFALVGLFGLSTTLRFFVEIQFVERQLVERTLVETSK